MYFDNYTTTYSDYYIKLKQLQLRKRQRIEQRRLNRNNNRNGNGKHSRHQERENSENELRLSRLVDHLDLSVSSENRLSRFLPQLNQHQRNKSGEAEEESRTISDSTHLFLAAEKLTKKNPNVDSSSVAAQMKDVKNRGHHSGKRKIKVPKFNKQRGTSELPSPKALGGEKTKFSKPDSTVVDYDFFLLTQRSNATDTVVTAPSVRLPNIYGVRRAESTRPTVNKKKFVPRKPERLVTGFSQDISDLEKSIAQIDQKLRDLKLRQQ